MTPANPSSAKRLVFAVALTCLGTGVLAGLGPSPVRAAPSPDLASELIAAVNQFRAGHGMAPLIVDPILMLVEQAQNEYSMSIGTITHYGPTGANQLERATAAGYGGGATIFASENIAMGSGLTPAGAVEMWTGDAPHLNTMLGQYYRDVGAGAGQEGGFYYYTLITAYIAGGHSARSTVPVGGIDLGAAGLAVPVVRATPGKDGSIVHIVQPGQTLWTIAAVYGVKLDELQSLNALTEGTLLHPGDQVRVRSATPATATSDPTTTAGPPPTETARPTRRPTAIRTPTPSSVAGDIALDPSTLFAAWVVVVLVLGAVFAVRKL